MAESSLNRTAEFVRRYWPAEGGQPKHEKLRQAFTRSIIDGYWLAGARLPTEAELVSVTPCSLGTVQRALRDLVSDGIIERRRGSGSIVADLRRPIEEPWHMRFFDESRKADSYLPVFTHVLQRRLINKKGPWSLALDQADRQVVRIDRIFSMDSKFDVYNVFYALADRFPELVDLPITALNGANLKIVIARRHHLPVHKVRQLLRFETPPTWVTANCVWPPGVPATILNVVAYSLDGEAMYYQDFYMPPTDHTLDLGTTARA